MAVSRGIGLGLNPGLPVVRGLQNRLRGVGEEEKPSQSAQCTSSSGGSASAGSGTQAEAGIAALQEAQV